MATSKELLKAIESGAEIRITIAGEPEGGRVEHSPRYKGDRSPWVYNDGRRHYRYAAKECAAVVKVDRDAQAEDLAPASAEENAAAEIPDYKVIGQDDMRSVVARLKAPAPVFVPAPKPSITPDVVAALATLRKTYLYPAERKALRTLYAAGVFAAIDGAAKALEQKGSDMDANALQQQEAAREELRRQTEAAVAAAKAAADAAAASQEQIDRMYGRG